MKTCPHSQGNFSIDSGFLNKAEISLIHEWFALKQKSRGGGEAKESLI